MGSVGYEPGEDGHGHAPDDTQYEHLREEKHAYVINNHGHKRNKFELKRRHRYHYYMKKKRWILYILIVLTLSAGIYVALRYKVRQDELRNWQGYNTMTYVVRNRTYRLLIADTPAKQERGLMYVKELKEFDGMIFPFAEEEYQTFWNGNTFRDLDIYWIRKGKVIGKDTLPSINKGGQVIVSSPERVDTVVEIIRPF